MKLLDHPNIVRLHEAALRFNGGGWYELRGEELTSATDMNY